MIEREKLTKFVNDPDWHIVEEIFWSYIEPLRYIDDIEISDSSTSVKAEIRTRKKMYKAVSSFLADIGLMKARKLDDPHDNMFE
jgi:hypothetical protein